MSYFTDLTWKESIKDIIDILIVSYIIYKVLNMVRGTRAVQLLKGIMVLVVIWGGSTLLDLYTLKWLMNQVFTFGILAIFIIFQPELRRGLEQLYRGKFFGRAAENDEEISKLIGEVIKAVNYLAVRKIGALIVFERATGLNEYTESGIAMRSEVSSELLINIFIPNTPLHDGALIMQGGQIAAAACYLPLSENPFISKELGTRHRAAIGISEVADSVSVVVSEETGQISLAINGQIVRDIKEESLISKLHQELSANSSLKDKSSAFWKRKGVRPMDKWMKNNNFNKILALALSIILWTIVHVDTPTANQTTVNTESKTIENVKVEIEGFDSDQYVLTKDVESVRMEVRGKRSDLTYKFSDAYRVWLDLSDVKPGDNTLPLMYSTPNGVTLDDMVPNQVNVHIELRTTKAFPVQVNISGAPAEGYDVGTPVIDPVNAEVTLPASDLALVAKVAGNIELDGENATFNEKRLRLAAYDSKGNELEGAVISPSTVAVELPITLPSKTLPLDISFTGSLPGSLVLSRVTPDQDMVTVYGSEEILKNLSSYEAVLNLSSITAPGTEQLKLELKPPEGTGKIEPAAMNVSVSSAEITQRTLSGVPIKLEGVDSGLTARILDPLSNAVDLTVTGAPTLLDQLDQDNISVTADAGGLSAGIHDLPLQVSLPRFIALQNNAQPLTVRIELLAPATPDASAGTDDATAPPTPEPNAEPASGEETVIEPTPTHSAEPVDPAPSPTHIPAENTATPAAGGNNAGSTGGT